MSVQEIFNYRKVSDELATAGIPTEEQLASLGNEGYRAVINLLPDDSEYAAKNEKEIIEAQGMAYHYIPVDYAKPSDNDFTQFSNVMDTVKNKKVLIHCAANYRVSAFYSAYAVRNKLWSREQAREFVASLWNPDDFPPWPAFIKKISGNGD